jgi:hypothetical protein
MSILALVAAIAVFGSTLIDRIDVTGRTRCGSVAAGQGEGGPGMIHPGLIPICQIMTGQAIRTIMIGGSLMTIDAGWRRRATANSHMTEGGARPTGSVVT